MTAHRYAAELDWAGSTAAGYDHFSRGHAATVAPAAMTLDLTADPAFLGDTTRLNPEQLLVLAAASCQLLSFLVVAARARVDVVAYHDDAGGEMPQADGPMRVTRITLHPRITVRGGVSDERIRHLVEVAHRECYIANSVTTEIVIEPEIVHSA
jgi:organic hydroperoxide reductase OsmC/OhrA